MNAPPTNKVTRFNQPFQQSTADIIVEVLGRCDEWMRQKLWNLVLYLGWWPWDESGVGWVGGWSQVGGVVCQPVNVQNQEMIDVDDVEMMWIFVDFEDLESYSATHISRCSDNQKDVLNLCFFSAEVFPFFQVPVTNMFDCLNAHWFWMVTSSFDSIL